MTIAVAEPAASADAVELADYLEISALIVNDRNRSLMDVRRDISRSGGAEVLDDPAEDPEEQDALVDPGGEDTEAVIDELAREVADREVATAGHYPFHFDGHTVQARRGADNHVYTFMLLLAYLGVGVGPSDGTRLFEDISAVAGERYFGGPHSDVVMYQFGFPRRIHPGNFVEALDELCRELGEGKGAKRRPQAVDQKDARLDLVFSRRFPDRRVGQITAFGQCATGKHWRTKLTDLQPQAFCKSWMDESPAVDPVRLFFVPHRVSEYRWHETTVYAGVVFDRCRIAMYSDSLPEPYRTECIDWNRAVLKELRG